MANEVTEEDREALKIAYISLAASGRKSDSFDMDLTVEALRVKKCLNDDSLQLRTLTATKIPAVVLDKTFEESSKRYKITFLAHGADKPETVRMRTQQIREDQLPGSALHHGSSILARFQITDSR